jgi:hypothetical protein
MGNIKAMINPNPTPVFYYTSTIEQNVINANVQIAANASIDQWAYVKKAYNQNLWFIRQPPIEGWNGYTQEQMIAGVVDVDLQPYNQNWFEPIPWPPSSLD